MIDYLGKAATKKQKGKQAVKDKKFDDAWRYFNEQKVLYLNHATQSGSGFDRLSTMVLEASVHVDFANILRLEGKYESALSHLSYVYKLNFIAKRPIATLEKKLQTYFSKVYDKEDYLRFRKLLEMLKGMDFVAVREFVELHYPQLPKVIED